VIADLDAHGVAITEEQVHAQMTELLAQAILEVKAGT
jgi:hypothetical protein